MRWDVKKDTVEELRNKRPPPPPPPKKPPADPEAVQGMTPPVELPPELRVWVAMYCAAIATGTHYREDAEEIADYGLISLRAIAKRLSCADG